MSKDRIVNPSLMLLVAVLALGSAALSIGAWRARHTLPPATVATVLSGEWGSEAEAVASEALPVRRAALSFVTAVRLSLFRWTDEAVVVGRDGVLFTSEEYAPARSDRILERVDGVERRVRLLESRGASVLVVIVPAKTSVIPEALPRFPAPPDPSDAAARLRGRGVAVLSLDGALSPARSFFSRDTHWTPDGADAAAAAIAKTVRDAWPETVASLPAATWRIVAREEVAHVGDLTSFVPLGALSDAFGFAPERVTVVRYVADIAAPTSLFDLPAVPLVLVGTSYSEGEPWALAPRIGAALDVDVVSFADAGAGPFAAVDDLIAAGLNPSLVVWEFPERYFRVFDPPGS